MTRGLCTVKKIAAVFMVLLLLVSQAACAEEVTSVVQMEYTLVMPDVTRTGLYTGAVKDGVPHGFGVFTTTNDYNGPWHYMGEWENGVISGQGGMYWDDGATRVGEFRNNTDFSTIYLHSYLYRVHYTDKTSEFFSVWDGSLNEQTRPYFEESNYFALTRTSEDLAGSFVKVTGRCYSASNGKLTSCYISLGSGSNEIVYVSFASNADIPYSLFPGDQVTVYGMYKGYSLLRQSESSYVLYPDIYAYAIEFVE